MAEPFRLSDMPGNARARVLNWAHERVEIPHDSPARDAAVMLLDLVAACTEVAQSSIDDHWLRAICMAALYGPEECGWCHHPASNGPCPKWVMRDGVSEPCDCDDPIHRENAVLRVVLINPQEVQG